MTEPDLPGDEPSGEERNFAVIAHLLGIIISFLGPLIIWLIKKDDSTYVDDQAREALNFQITVFIAEAVCGFLTMIVIGCVLLPIVLIANFILCIVAAVAASQGRWYRYPMTFRLIS
ncbi:MAG: DUF4870 domain-containing protein [Planctomycetota bacterium]|jgi:uncharacterized Tic20 family protein